MRNRVINRVLTGRLVGSTNRLQYIKSKRLHVEVKYIEKILGNKIIKINIL